MFWIDFFAESIENRIKNIESDYNQIVNQEMKSERERVGKLRQIDKYMYFSYIEEENHLRLITGEQIWQSVY